jgi:hypothetical protein
VYKDYAKIKLINSNQFMESFKETEKGKMDDKDSKLASTKGNTTSASNLLGNS